MSERLCFTLHNGLHLTFIRHPLVTSSVRTIIVIFTDTEQNWFWTCKLKSDHNSLYTVLPVLCRKVVVACATKVCSAVIHRLKAQMTFRWSSDSNCAFNGNTTRCNGQLSFKEIRHKTQCKVQSKTNQVQMTGDTVH